MRRELLGRGQRANWGASESLAKNGGGAETMTVQLHTWSGRGAGRVRKGPAALGSQDGDGCQLIRITEPIFSPSMYWGHLMAIGAPQKPLTLAPDVNSKSGRLSTSLSTALLATNLRR